MPVNRSGTDVVHQRVVRRLRKVRATGAADCGRRTRAAASGVWGVAKRERVRLDPTRWILEIHRTAMY